MADLRLVADAMFTNRYKWDKISDIEKESCFFIFNRYFSKKYPHLSQLINLKNMDRLTGINLWFHFMEGKSYPSWFWSKTTHQKEDTLSESEIKLLIRRLELDYDDITYLYSNHKEILLSELKYYKSLL